MSKNQPVSAVKAPPTDVPALISDWISAAREAGFRQEQVGSTPSGPLVAFTRRALGNKPRVYLSAGIHGDEPAPPRALLSLVRQGFFGDAATWFICPVLNPEGLARGTRENAQGIDLNRDFKALTSPEIRAQVTWLRRQPNFEVTICLHEDWEAKGFYLYELNPEGRPSLAPAMIAAARTHMPIDTSPEIDGRQALNGVIHPADDPALRELWPESIYLRAEHGTLAYTIETASGLPLQQRIDTLAAAVRAAVTHPSLAARRRP